MDTYTLPSELDRAWRNVAERCEDSMEVAKVVLDVQPEIAGLSNQTAYRRNMLVTASALIDLASFYNNDDTGVAGDILAVSEHIRSLIKET